MTLRQIYYVLVGLSVENVHDNWSVLVKLVGNETSDEFQTCELFCEEKLQSIVN